MIVCCNSGRTYGNIGPGNHDYEPFRKREKRMDGSKFDNLARTLGHGTSRRTMLRGLAGGFAGILAGGTLVHQGAGAAGRELVICHATGDPNAPYQTMTIQQTEMNMHARHGDFVRVECCTDSDCASQGQVSCETGYCIGTATCGAPGAHCTIAEFVTQCCANPDGSTGCFFPTGDPNNGVCFLP